MTKLLMESLFLKSIAVASPEQATGDYMRGFHIYIVGVIDFRSGIE